jgi:3',5'-cyclic AMP phosphodiesterase CpdA
LRAELKPLLSFGVVADPQYADIDPWSTRFYRQSISKLTEAVARFNESDLSFCVNVGDLIDRGWQSYDAIMEPLISSRHKFHHLLGNHDFELEDMRKPSVPARLGLKRRYYALTRGSWCFEMLDTNDISVYAHPSNSTERVDAVNKLRQLESTGAINARAWNGAVSDHQLQWLEATCRTAAAAARKVIVFAHHPVFPVGEHTAWNSDRVLEVVSRNRNVVAWMNGHNHAGAFGIVDELPFVTLKGMVETEDTNAYAVAHLHADRLVLMGHGREPSRELHFRPEHTATR